jgi:phosphoglycerate dehydrogenase-like enzyme
VAIGEGLARGTILFTTARGVQTIPISEWVIGAMTALVKRFPKAIHAQGQREYWKFIGEELAGRTAGILGLGNIGQRVARICQSLDMRVIGIRRSVSEPLEGQGPADLLLPPRDLPLMLKQSDFLIICLPGTRETLGLLGAVELQQLKQGSYLINVGRGGIVDEEALVHAVRTGHLAGAALDVFAQEPLPPDSPLWDEPNILLTAHVAANSHLYEERATQLFLENLRRYLGAQDLLNVYDPERGY